MTAATAILTLGSQGIALAAPSSASSGTNKVTYRGHEFTVPDNWKVVNLEDHPTACVRFDKHAVYLGNPAADQDCPADLSGRTEALLIQPAGRTGKAATVTENSAAHTYEVTADRISVTAVYGSDKGEIQKILRSDSLPVGGVSAQPRATAQALPDDATSFQGKGFDACTAPSTASMNAWKSGSSLGAVGVYIGGVNRACSQENLTPDWVQAQYQNGWRFIPLYVGLQVSNQSCRCSLITDPTPQGAAAANDAVAQAMAFGFGKGSVLYYDMETYTPGGTNTTKALDFFTSWSNTLHQMGYRSGVYGDVSGVMHDLVAAANGGNVIPDVINFAHFDGNAATDDPAIPGNLWANHQRIKQYQGGHNETHGGVTINIDSDQLDVGAGSAPPPAKKKTMLAFTGPMSVANGSPAELSAKLTDENGTAVSGRDVSFVLGTGDHQQSCTGHTASGGVATCTTGPVDQPLTADATVPVTAQFAGDDAFEPSKVSATVRLQNVSGRAFGLSAKIPLLVLPISIPPTPDTGEVRTAGAQTTAPPCSLSVNTLLLSADTLCAKVTTETGPSKATATANLEDAHIGLLGLPVIGLSGVHSTSTSTCAAQSGDVGLTLTVAGVPVNVGNDPNFHVNLGIAGTSLIVNEQIKNADGGLTVNAVHLTAPGGIDVVVASSTTAAHNC